MIKNKIDKTIDEWVKIMTDKNYRYVSLFPTKRSVVDYLLCTIGTGYGFKNGYVYEEASGADEDVAIYGDWKNATFDSKIDDIVKGIMGTPEVKETIETAYNFLKSERERRLKIEKERLCKMFDDIKSDDDDDDFNKEVDELLKSIMNGLENNKEKEEVIKEKYQQYYPICEYSNITKIDENSHPSYINTGIEVCEEILNHESEEDKDNIEFARKYLNRFKKYIK